MPTKKSMASVLTDESDDFHKGSGSRDSSAEPSNRFSDEDILRWFSRDPTYELRTQLQRTIRQLIALGFVREGEALPGIKRVARIANIYPSAVFFVYSALQDQGILTAEHGRGFFVTDSLPARLTLASEDIARAIRECRRYGLTDEQIKNVFKNELGRDAKKRAT